MELKMSEKERTAAQFEYKHMKNLVKANK